MKSFSFVKVSDQIHCFGPFLRDVHVKFNKKNLFPNCLIIVINSDHVNIEQSRNKWIYVMWKSFIQGGLNEHDTLTKMLKPPQWIFLNSFTHIKCWVTERRRVLSCPGDEHGPVGVIMTFKHSLLSRLQGKEDFIWSSRVSV